MQSSEVIKHIAELASSSDAEISLEPLRAPGRGGNSGMGRLIGHVEVSNELHLVIVSSSSLSENSSDSSSDDRWPRSANAFIALSASIPVVREITSSLSVGMAAKLSVRGRCGVRICELQRICITVQTTRDFEFEVLIYLLMSR